MCANIEGMTQVATRDAVVESLRTLPPNASLDDIIERVLLVGKIKTGLAQSDARDLIAHAQVVERFKK
jgi:hypothetical protein